MAKKRSKVAKKRRKVITHTGRNIALKDVRLRALGNGGFIVGECDQTGGRNIAAFSTLPEALTWLAANMARLPKADAA